MDETDEAGREGGKGGHSNLPLFETLRSRSERGCTPKVVELSGSSASSYPFVLLLSLSLSIPTECSPSPSPPPGAHPSLQPVSSATAALSATSEPGCFAIII